MGTKSILVKSFLEKKCYFKTVTYLTSQLNFILNLFQQGKNEHFLLLQLFNLSVLQIQHSLFKFYQITKTKSINNVFSDIVRIFFSFFFRGFTGNSKLVKTRSWCIPKKCGKLITKKVVNPLWKMSRHAPATDYIFS